MTYDQPESGDQNELGVYRTPQELAAILRRAADQLDGQNPRWGAFVMATLVDINPHPAWASPADLRVSLIFRDPAPNVATIFSTT